MQLSTYCSFLLPSIGFGDPRYPQTTIKSNNSDKDVTITKVLHKLYICKTLTRFLETSTLRNSASFSVFKTQSSVPIHLVIISLKSGLQKRIHLLGVTPFVLF